MNGEIMGCVVDTQPLERKLKKLLYGVGQNATEATTEALEHIHQKAMENLNENLRWGHSIQEEEQIESTKVIETWAEGNKIKGSLKYTSPHAKLIEYGGFYVYNKNRDTKVMPIGLQQGNVQYFSYDIVVNYPGKYFLTRAIMSESESVKSIYNKYRNNLIGSLD